MGVASEVTDEKIRKKALDNPGEVIRINRSGGSEKVSAARRKALKRSAPKPSRKKLDAAQKRLEQLRCRQESEIAAIERELKSLQAKQADLERRYRKARFEAEEKVEAARADYKAALEEWSPGD